MCLWLGIQAFCQASALQWYRALVIVALLDAIHNPGFATVVLPIARHLARIFEELVNVNTMANESLRDVLYKVLGWYANEHYFLWIGCARKEDIRLAQCEDAFQRPNQLVLDAQGL